jgi:hypothetical protein
MPGNTIYIMLPKLIIDCRVAALRLLAKTGVVAELPAPVPLRLRLAIAAHRNDGNGRVCRIGAVSLVIRLVTKLTTQPFFMIYYTANEIESESQSFSSVTVFFRHYFKRLYAANYVFNLHSAP